MKRIETRLTLVAPRAMQGAVANLLHSHPEWVTGFAIRMVEEQGPGIELADSAEQVNGRAQRVEFDILLERDEAQALLDVVKTRMAGRDVVYWLTPMIEYGRCA